MAEMTIQKTDHPNVTLNYYRYKKVMIFNPKDYGDKQCIFAHNGCIYAFSTTNGKGLEEQAPQVTPPPDRCDTIVTCFKFYTDDEGRVMLEDMVQCDSRTNIPDLIMKTVAPSTIATWFKNWKKYVLKEHN